MKVSKHNVPIYYDRNMDFNNSIHGVVQNIFQHQKVGHIGYIPARMSNPILQPSKLVVTIDPPVASGEYMGLHERFNLAGVGEYEKGILSCLVYGDYSTYVLTGDMGSGKTATMNHLVEVLRQPRLKTCGVCEHCVPVVITLNFNGGFHDDDTPTLVRTFKKYLYDELRRELRQLYKSTNLTDGLRAELLNGGGGPHYAAFDRFVQMHENYRVWKGRSNAEKTNLLFTYVDECTKNGSENIRVMMSLLHLTKKKLRADPACLVLIFDNIDSILPEAQYKILALILSYQVIAEAKALVAMRRATFVKFEENRAALPFGTINHIGPNAKEIVLRRLNYYNENWASLPELRDVSQPAYLQAVKDRLDYLIGTKDDPRGALQRVMGICGSSVRLGLYMCERFFINTTVPFDEPPRNKDDIVRAVLVEPEKGNEISPEDKCIANLLLNRVTGEASLLNIRILQLVAELEDDKPNRTVSRLCDKLSAIGGWNREAVRTSLNYLLNMRRPLLWVDGKSKYDSRQMARNADDVLHLTEAGYFYLREFLFDLVYMQEAALSVKWRAVNIPNKVDYSVTVERFQVLRCFLEALAVLDEQETKNFMAWLEVRGWNNVKPVFIVNRIIASVGRSALNIFLQRISDPTKHDVDDKMKHDTLEELRYWQSVVNKWLRKERELTGTVNNKMWQLSVDYSQRLSRM